MAIPPLEIVLPDLSKQLRGIEHLAPQALTVGMYVAMEQMAAHLISKKISGQYLGVETGAARRSIQHGARLEVDIVRGWIGSALTYVRAHEEGFKGTVSVKAFSRRRARTKSKSGRRGKWEHRGSIAVKAHTRRMNMRARHFFADTLTQNIGKAKLRLVRSLLILGRQQRLPSHAEVRQGFTG